MIRHLLSRNRRLVTVGVLFFMTLAVTGLNASGVKGAHVDDMTDNHQWTQDTFIISSFHPLAGTATDLQLMLKHKEAGFNLLEMTFTSRSVSERAVQYANVVGMNVLVGEASDPQGRFGGFQNIDVTTPTEETIIQVIESYGDSEALYGYYVWDEPEPVNFENAGNQVALFRRHAPDKLAFVVAMPSYWDYFRGNTKRYEQYWDDYAAMINPQVVSSNHYPFFNEIRLGIPLERSTVWRDLGYVRLKSLELDVPMWFYIQLSDDLVSNNLGSMTIEKVRLQAYYAMVYGATGISYYNTLEALMDVNANPTAIFDDVKALNHEIMNVGTKLLELRSTGIYHTGRINALYTDAIDELDLLEKAPEDIILGTFEDGDGEGYWFVVNRSYTHELQDEIIFSEPVTLWKVSKEHGGEELLGEAVTSLTLDLRAGEGALYHISR